MTRQGIIENLLILASGIETDGKWSGDPMYGDMANMLREAADMLIEQDPVVPVLGDDEWYRCGNCAAPIASFASINRNHSESWHRYRQECGRMVKWE